MNIDELPADRTTDALIAEAMGWEGRTIWYASNDGGGSGMFFSGDQFRKHDIVNFIAEQEAKYGRELTLCSYEDHPQYSLYMGDAWSIVTDMLADGDEAFTLHYKAGEAPDPSVMVWFAEFRHAEKWAIADNAALAIVRAALKVKLAGR